MGLWTSLAGSLCVEITSADIAGFLNAVRLQEITLYDVKKVDTLTIHGIIQRTHYRICKELTERRGEKIKVIKKKGMYWKIKSMWYRPIMLVGITFFLAAALYIPSRIFFVNVEGNVTIPTKMILEQAESCGILFGASRREVRSEKVKNALLSKIPSLQWAGVNTSGCIATISVKEKSTINKAEETNYGVSSIVASRDGIICECTITRGNPLCYVGQAVKAGEILVSGYTNCGISIRATRAEAEVFAQTQRNLEVITPCVRNIRDNMTDKEVRYSLIIGKKLIKFYNDSGISDTTCVKMYTKKIITLPGAFQLPVVLLTEELIYCDTFADTVKDPNAFGWLETYAQTYLNSQMISGEILQSKTVTKLQQDTITLHGQYDCTEMIGQVKKEEIIKPNGENN